MYRIARNLHTSLTNTPGKFCNFYFRDKVTMSDHTPYNFQQGSGDPQCVFQCQNDSKMLPFLSKCVGCRRQKNCHAKGRELYNSEDLFTVAVTTSELIVGRKKFTQFAQMLLRQSIYWICGSKTLCPARCQHKIFGGRNFHGIKFSRAGV